jgi:hypothetical protein
MFSINPVYFNLPYLLYKLYLLYLLYIPQTSLHHHLLHNLFAHGFVNAFDDLFFLIQEFIF